MGNSSSTNVQAVEPIRSQELVLHDDTSAREAVQHTTCDFVDPRSLVDNLRPGDMIEVKGNLFYSHFAVFIGNGEIVHVTSDNCIQEKSTIARANMVNQFRGALVRKNNYLDNSASFHTHSIPQIVLAARNMVGQPWEYDVLKHNCEHFATRCRYGREISLQTLSPDDLVSGRVSWREFVACCFKITMASVATYSSWAKRKRLGFRDSFAETAFIKQSKDE